MIVGAALEETLNDSLHIDPRFKPNTSFDPAIARAAASVALGSSIVRPLFESLPATESTKMVGGGVMEMPCTEYFRVLCKSASNRCAVCAGGGVACGEDCSAREDVVANTRVASDSNLQQVVFKTAKWHSELATVSITPGGHIVCLCVPVCAFDCNQARSNAARIFRPRIYPYVDTWRNPQDGRDASLK